jgi:hypothetical protein
MPITRLSGLCQQKTAFVLLRYPRPEDIAIQALFAMLLIITGGIMNVFSSM